MHQDCKYTSDRFIGRWAAGELSPEEVTAFEEWLSSNPEHRAEFAEIHALWKSSGKEKPGTVRSREERWAMLKERIGLSEEDDE